MRDEIYMHAKDELDACREASRKMQKQWERDIETAYYNMERAIAQLNTAAIAEYEDTLVGYSERMAAAGESVAAQLSAFLDSVSYERKVK